MKTIDLTHGDRTLAEVLALAKDERVLIHAVTGDDFLLEPADAFDLEAAAMSRSASLRSLLDERAKETGGTSLDDIRKRMK